MLRLVVKTTDPELFHWNSNYKAYSANWESKLLRRQSLVVRLQRLRYIEKTILTNSLLLYAALPLVSVLALTFAFDNSIVMTET